MTQPRPPRPSLASVQYLRAGAALAVVFFHANGISQEYFGHSWATFGAAGVDVFFVVSGLIMWVTASGQTSPIAFVKNRIVRIVPLYWGMTLLLYAGWLVARTAPDIEDLLKSLLFIPYVSTRTGEIDPLLIAGWTLNFEMFFYALFATALLIPKRGRALFIFGTLSALVLIGLCVPVSAPFQKVYTSPLLLEFGLGCAVGMLFQRGVMPRPFVGALLGSIGLLVLLAADGSASDLSAARLLHWGLPAVLIVVGALGFEPVRTPRHVLLLLGNASYSIYLAHTTVIAGLKDLILISEPHWGSGFSGAFIGTAIVASTGVGVWVYRFAEQPIQTYLKIRSAKHPATVASRASSG